VGGALRGVQEAQAQAPHFRKTQLTIKSADAGTVKNFWGSYAPNPDVPSRSAQRATISMPRARPGRATSVISASTAPGRCGRHDRQMMPCEIDSLHSGSSIHLSLSLIGLPVGLCMVQMKCAE
jgi:hypothetical protein